MCFASPGSRRLTVPGGYPGRFAGGGKKHVVSRREEVMTSYQTERVVPCHRDGPPVDVMTWRRCRLLEAGFHHDLAEMLAGTPSVDLHALLQLVDRGCSPELAARILSPLDWGAGPS
jgi:hypothetical protein